jgi:hypothetical protein
MPHKFLVFREEKYFLLRRATDKKEKKILIYKEIQKGVAAKSYMTNGLLICI